MGKAISAPSEISPEAFFQTKWKASAAAHIFSPLACDGIGARGCIKSGRSGVQNRSNIVLAFERPERSLPPPVPARFSAPLLRELLPRHSQRIVWG